MGQTMFDQYSFLHFSVGAVSYYWNVSLIKLLIIHTIFELLENTVEGIKLINKFKYWPGGKDRADAPINMVGDTISVALGWAVAYLLNNVSY